jgi:hypothetical protein
MLSLRYELIEDYYKRGDSVAAITRIESGIESEGLEKAMLGNGTEIMGTESVDI